MARAHGASQEGMMKVERWLDSQSFGQWESCVPTSDSTKTPVAKREAELM